jgi:hypothetical protein
MRETVEEGQRLLTRFSVVCYPLCVCPCLCHMELHASNYSAATMLRTKIPICKCSAVIAMLAIPNNATDVEK